MSRRPGVGSVWFGLGFVTALALSTTGLVADTASGAVPVAKSKGNAAAGIGSKAALANPDCDSDTGRVAIPYQWPPPCVKPLAKGGDNGGETADGVKADSVDVVVRLAADPETPAPGNTNLGTGATAPPAGAYRDIAAAWAHALEGWGREVNFKFVVASGTDETADRADAVSVTAMKPFAVLDNLAKDVFCTEVAARDTICISAAGDNEKADVQQPYRYVTGIDYWASTIYVPELIGKGLWNKKARWAGDPDMQEEKRVFGVVYPAGTGGIDIALFKKELAKYGAKVAVEVPYDVQFTTVPEQLQQNAPLMITKLKDAGVNNVVLFGGNAPTSAMTKAATQQEFRPEWTITAFQVQDLDLFARGGYDQSQWAHAFGVGNIRPAVYDQGGPEFLYTWYWGPNRGAYTTNTSTFSTLGILYRGLHLAGPKLTPESFRAGFFAMPPTGGATQGMVINSLFAPGDKAGMPWTEYMIGGDFTLVWYGADVEGVTNVGAAQGKGKLMYLDDAKRYRPGELAKKEPKFFDLNSSVGGFETRPPADKFPPYACDGCPSSGGTSPTGS